MFVNQPNFVPTSSHQQQQHRRSLSNLVVVSSAQGSLSPSATITCGVSSPMSPKPNTQSCNDGKNRKTMVNRNQQQQQQQQPQQQQLSELQSNPTSSGNVAPKPMEKTMAAVVLVSNQNNNNNNNNNSSNNNNNNVLEDFSNFENNNNSVNINRTSKVCSVGLCTSSNNACASALSNNVCTAITNNFFISPSSGLLLGKEKHLKNNNISDIKSLEQLEFLCLQMTEQAIN